LRSTFARLPKLASAVLALLAVCTVTSLGHASPEGEADRLIARGVELRQQSKDEEALALFKKALALAPTPRALAQVALAEQALGLWVPAEGKLTAALADGRDPWIAKNRAALEGALATITRHVGGLEVHGTEGAEVFLDGVSIGTLPSSVPFRVEPGPRTLELSKPGYHSTARAIEIVAGGTTRATIVLAPLATSPAEAQPIATGEPHPRDVPVSEPPPERGHFQRTLGWSVAIAGVGALAFGGIGVAVRSSIVADYNGACPGLGAAQSTGCKEKVADARTWLTVSTIAFIAGGILAASGVTVVVTAPSGSTSPKTTMSCAPELSRFGLACVGRF
jgi:hypothetical protein